MLTLNQLLETIELAHDIQRRLTSRGGHLLWMTAITVSSVRERDFRILPTGKIEVITPNVALAIGELLEYKQVKELLGLALPGLVEEFLSDKPGWEPFDRLYIEQIHRGVPGIEFDHREFTLLLPKPTDKPDAIPYMEFDVRKNCWETKVGTESLFAVGRNHYRVVVGKMEQVT